MNYIGIDLAWGTRATTAGVALTGEGEPAHGATLVASDDALTDDDSILAFVKTWDEGSDLLVAIDAPTRVPNETGRRPCEDTLSRLLRRYEAGPHPANRRLLAGADGTIRGERLVAALEKRGIRHTPYLTELSPCRAAFEVFPHPAHIALFDLEKTLKYKAKPKRTFETRLAEFARYTAFLKALAQADPPLLVPEPFDLLNRDLRLLRPRALKRYEDSLDALTCAYVALYRHRHGDPRCPVLGDLITGYIVTPLPSPEP